MIDFANFELRDFASLAYTTTGPAATVSAGKLASGHAGRIDPVFDWDDKYIF